MIVPVNMEIPTARGFQTLSWYLEALGKKEVR